MLMEQHWLRQQFSGEAARPDATLNLARCALLIAAEEYPEVEPNDYLVELDDMAEVVRARARGGGPATVREELHGYLFDELGFTGNAADYFDPRNSYLSEVLDRHTGIPLTLSLVYLEVGWRLGLPLAGVGLPGHFLVRSADPEGACYVDPFNGGAMMDEQGCADLMRRAVGEGFPFRSEYLWPVSKRQMLSRLLGNLKVIYQQRKDDARTLAALDRMLELDPDGPAELWERAQIYSRFRALALAQSDMKRALECGGRNSEQIDEVRRQLADLQRLWLN